MGDTGQIVIQLSDVYAEGNLANAIVDAAASKLLESELESVMGLRKRIESISDAEIKEALRPIIAQALEGVVQPTDSFGKPKGEVTTLREVIMEAVKKDLKQSVADRQNYIGSRSRDYPVLQYLIEREVSRVVTNDLKEAMDAARKTVREAVEARGAEILAETISRMART